MTGKELRRKSGAANGDITAKGMNSERTDCFKARFYRFSKAMTIAPAEGNGKSSYDRSIDVDLSKNGLL